jgi:hypothetical protein
MTEFSNIDVDLQEYNQQIDFINNSIQSINILDQVPSYNYIDTQIFLNNINKELEQQKTINNLLSSNQETIKNQVEKIKEFADSNMSIIDNQLLQLKNITAELKDIVLQNGTLKQKYSEVNELATNEKYIALAKNIQEIKQQKQDILDFLKNNGVIAAPLI